MEDNPNYSIVEIGQNTEKSFGDLLSLKLQWKPLAKADVKTQKTKIVFIQLYSFKYLFLVVIHLFALIYNFK